MLNPTQKSHVNRVYPECRAAMAKYLEEGVKVFVTRQKETGPDVPPWAIAVKSQPDFWIDCKETKTAAIEYARSLGLVVSSHPCPNAH